MRAKIAGRLLEGLRRLLPWKKETTTEQSGSTDAAEPLKSPDVCFHSLQPNEPQNIYESRDEEQEYSTNRSGTFLHLAGFLQQTNGYAGESPRGRTEGRLRWSQEAFKNQDFPQGCTEPRNIQSFWASSLILMGFWICWVLIFYLTSVTPEVQNLQVLHVSPPLEVWME